MTLRKDEYARRRKQLMKLMGKGAIAIIPAAPERQRNSDVHYHYRPDSDFHYLTGFNEPEAVAVLIPGREQAEYILFVRDRDPTRETWDGRRAGPEGAVRDYGADDAFPIGDIDDIIPGLIERCERVYYSMGVNLEFDQRVVGWVNTLRGQTKLGVHSPQEFVALEHPLHDMRLFKSKAEAAVMKRSAQIAVGAHVRAMRTTRPGVAEYEVMAELLHEFHRHQADISYHPIVGGGANGCILHYHENADTLRDGDLLLIDAGCEYGLYASDITRTFPVNGRFTPEQKAIYDVVLEAQEAAFACVKPGNHWNEPHDAAVRADHAGPGQARPAQGPGAGVDQGRGLPQVLHAPHRALARHGRARRRRIQGRRRMARIRARHGADGGTGDLHSRRHQGRAKALVEHRRADRGRRAGHGQRLRPAHVRLAAHHRRNRAHDGVGRLTRECR